MLVLVLVVVFSSRVVGMSVVAFEEVLFSIGAVEVMFGVVGDNVASIVVISDAVGADVVVGVVTVVAAVVVVV